MNSRTQFKASPKLTVSLRLWDERVLSEASSDMAVGGGRNQRVGTFGAQEMTQACMGICVSRAHMDKGKPIRYGRMPGSQADVEFSPFQSCLEMSGAVGL